MAKKVLELAYSSYGKASQYDLSAEEAAEKTLKLLIKEGESQIPISDLTNTARYIKTIMSVPDKKWGGEKPMRSTLALRVHDVLIHQENMPLEKRNSGLKKRLTKTKKYISKENTITNQGLYLV